MKKTFEKAYKLALSNNGILLTSEKQYKSNIPSTWKCEKNHIFKSTYGNLAYHNRWCSECSGNKKFGNSYTLEDCRKLAIARNGLCLSDSYKSCNEYFIWKCEKGHIWKAKFSNVLNSNNWCRKCSGSFKHTIEEIKLFAIEKKGKCLSDNYKDNKQKLLWECEKGHQWFAKFNLIQSCNSWCPECKMWKTQKELYKIICYLFGEDKCYFNYRGFDWLRMPDTNYPMEIDIFIKSHNKNIAIEYHGEQHFRPVEYFGGQKSFERVKLRDKVKKELLEKHLDSFIVIKSGQLISIESIKDILHKKGIFY